MKLSLAFTSLSCLVFAPTTWSQPSELYVYAIYFGHSNCEDNPGIVRGYRTDQDWALHGFSSENNTNLGDRCALESLCSIHHTSPVCTDDNEYIKSGEGKLSISEEGLIFECDETNADAECSFLDQCYSSSVYPHCNFLDVTTSWIVANPSSLFYSTAATEPALDLTSYFVFYSDDQCQNVEGIEGVVNNSTTTMGLTTDAVDCRNAMTCAFHPEEGKLGTLCQELLGVDVPPTLELTMDPISNGQAVPCDADGNCAPVDPSACQKSDLHPSCYYRLATAATLFSDPADFLPNYILDKDLVSSEESVDSTEDGTSEDESAAVSLRRDATIVSLIAGAILAFVL